ncbi:hypothetical protein QQX98_011488 [Neonectria punicea]|uniref:Uncharacterized protein n=1 Tax=Neonectria punicea TaxID=979145 RepID=A0ABR1GLX8_9HYPO
MANNQQDSNTSADPNGSKESKTTPPNPPPTPSPNPPADPATTASNNRPARGSRTSEPKIKNDALLENQRITAHRDYRPRELDIGSIASPGHTITVFIPLTLPYPSNAPKLPDVMYQPHRETEAVQEPMPWHIGVPIQIPGNSRIVVKQGTICFEMVQYDWEPAKDPQREEQGVAEAS